MGSKRDGKRLTPEGAAKRLCIGVADLPGIGRPWTSSDVAEAQRGRPDWLSRARKSFGAAQAEQARQQQAYVDAVRLRQSTFEYPALSVAATNFAHAFARANLLEFLHSALDVAAADTYVVDCGFDVSMHAQSGEETNRERAQRGISLSGRDSTAFADFGGYRAPGTLGDLLDAPTGNTRAAYVSGAGLDAESFDDAWHDQWPLQGLAHAYMVAGLAFAGDIETMETIAGVPLADAPADMREPFGGIAADVLSLAREALHQWTEIDCPVLDPGDIADMAAPISLLPRMLLSARKPWDQTERLAALIAGLGGVTVERLADG
ncbi:hypothetical protein [Mycobacterium sp.]|uniref:hypothetical protein n=1 Tax=Mycobacterium sp. TaxID=1785 RepID=UPI002580DDF1|nr:hypothetical protein [Mycobacterium sp.]